MTMMTVRMRMMRVAIIPARIPRKGVNCSGTGDSEIQYYIVRGHNLILNLPTWSWATLVVNTSSVTGSLFPFPFSAEMISLTSRPGLRPVTVKWGLMEDTLARTRLLRPSTTSRTKTWSRPPSNPGWHSTWISSVVCRGTRCWNINIPNQRYFELNYRSWCSRLGLRSSVRRLLN